MAYPVSMTPAQFVARLTQMWVIVVLADDQLVADLTAATKTRAQVLRAVADDQDLINPSSTGLVLRVFWLSQAQPGCSV
jgi:hypothetical protein